MARLLTYFFRGLVVLAPLVLTVWLTIETFRRVDRWLGGLFGFTIPGAGVLLTLALITLFGFLASNLLARTLLGAVEGLFARLPFVRLLYGSTRDLLNAFVGERRRFDTPVVVTLSPESNLKTLGFVTQESLEHYGLDGYVAVYLPQSYNFAGNLVVVPASQVERIRAKGADVMAFIISGGVTGAGEAGRAQRCALPGNDLPHPPLPGHPP
jgi:uncharacterized membrane protein